MEKTFNFGKVDYNNCGRRVNAVTVTVCLENIDKGARFTACAYVWNASKTDILAGGQCLDMVATLLRGATLSPEQRRTFNRILFLWHKYHLNDMHAGTEMQEDCLAHQPDQEHCTDKEWLEKCGLLEDDGYVYGTGWQYREIPWRHMAWIKELFGEKKPENDEERYIGCAIY